VSFTPGPWRKTATVRGWPMVVQDAPRGDFVCLLSETVPKARANANARRIIKAVNAHDDLMEAAKGALARYPELNVLRAAVKKAEGR